MVQLAAADSTLDQDRKSKAAWQAALLRQWADDLERVQTSPMTDRRKTLLADVVELPAGTQVVFTIQSDGLPSVEVRGPNLVSDAIYVSVHP